MTGDVKIKWYGKQVLRKYKVATRTGLKAAAIDMVKDIRQTMGDTGTSFKATFGKLSEDLGKVTRRRRIIRAPSAPGQPPRRQTGRLAESITHDFLDINRGLVRVGTNLLYARGMELGTAAHAIEPVEGKMLAWPGNWKSSLKTKRATGNMVFAKTVWHPGTAPRPFLRPAIDRVYASKGIERAIRKAIKAREAQRGNA